MLLYYREQNIQQMEILDIVDAKTDQVIHKVGKFSNDTKSLYLTCKHLCHLVLGLLIDWSLVLVPIMIIDYEVQ